MDARSTLAGMPEPFVCPRCGASSHNPHDIEERYCGACHTFVDQQLSMYTIYDHPLDYPDHFVVRRWEIGASTTTPTDDVQLARTLEGARQLVPVGCAPLPRHEADDATIVETWV